MPFEKLDLCSSTRAPGYLYTLHCNVILYVYAREIAHTELANNPKCRASTAICNLVHRPASSNINLLDRQGNNGTFHVLGTEKYRRGIQDTIGLADLKFFTCPLAEELCMLNLTFDNSRNLAQGIPNAPTVTRLGNCSTTDLGELKMQGRNTTVHFYFDPGSGTTPRLQFAAIRNCNVWDGRGQSVCLQPCFFFDRLVSGVSRWSRYWMRQ